jgi:ribosomal protein S18 acetylase RimI-like enzyme
MHMIFRDADVSDTEAVARLHALSWRSAYQGILDKEFLDKFCETDRLVVWRARLSAASAERRLVRLAAEGATLVGFACVSLDEDVRWGARLDHLHVHPESKGRGIGRQLMRQAAAWVADRRPQSSLHLWVYEDNRSARGFYEHLGGTAVERILHHAPDGNDIPAVCYVWQDLAGLMGRTPK